MNGHCLVVVIVCLVSAFLDFSAGDLLETSARDGNFCFWINSISNGQTHYMFLLRTAVDGRRSFVLFDSIWSKENSLVDCITSNNPAVIKSFSLKCRNVSEKPDARFNVSVLVEPDGPCVAVGHLPDLRGTVRRTRDLQNMGHEIIYREGSQKLKRSKRAWLVPGTLWCGSGNKASDFSDLGLYEETDKCCREHDHCEQTIASFGFGYGVFNTNFFTLSHCDCDSKFRRCLHNANDSMSNMVGYGYFNVLKMQCFEFSQRIECSERTWWGMCKHSQMSTYALVKDATNFNSTFKVLEDDTLDINVHHTVSFGDLTVTNDLAIPSDNVNKEVNEKHSSVSVPGRISVTVNTSQEYEAQGKTTTEPEPTDSPRVQTTGLPRSETTDSVQTQTDSPVARTSETTDESLTGTTDSLRRQNDSKTTESTIREVTGTSRISTDSPKAQTDSPKAQTDSPKAQTDSPKAQTDSAKAQTDSAKAQTDSPKAQTDSAKAQTDSAKVQTDSPKAQTDSAKAQTDSAKAQTDSPKAQTDSAKAQTDSAKVQTDSPKAQTDSAKEQTDSPKMETHPKKQSTKLHINPETYITQKDRLETCEVYKDLDTCRYQIPALQEKFGLHNAEHATLYHCNCTARLARVLAEEDEVDKVHFWLLDFVSQSCFFLPRNCTGNESCSTSSLSHDAPLVERWSKSAAVWRHLAAPRRKATRLNPKRAKRKDSPIRLHRKCLRMHSKLHHPKTPVKQVVQTVQ